MLERRLPASEGHRCCTDQIRQPAFWVLSATSTRRSTPRCGLGIMFVASPAARTGERYAKSGPAWLPTDGNRAVPRRPGTQDQIRARPGGFRRCRAGVACDRQFRAANVSAAAPVSTAQTCPLLRKALRGGRTAAGRAPPAHDRGWLRRNWACASLPPGCRTGPRRRAVSATTPPLSSTPVEHRRGAPTNAARASVR